MTQQPEALRQQIAQERAEGIAAVERLKTQLSNLKTAYTLLTQEKHELQNNVFALEAALRQTVENVCAAKLCEVNSMSSRAEMLRLMDKAITAAKQALEGKA